MCSNIGNDRIIYLHTRGDFWCQWIYQFAHEYCHHIINGTMTGELSGLMWFEESVCELASMYNLNSLFKFGVNIRNQFSAITPLLSRII